MNTLKTISFGAMMTRAQAAERYTIGWNAAVELGLVPVSLANDLNIKNMMSQSKAFSQMLAKAQKAAELKQDHALIRRRELAGAEVHAKQLYKQHIQDAKDEYAEAVKNAKAKRDAATAAARAKRDAALAAIRTERHGLEGACTPQNYQEQLQAMNRSCQDYVPQLRGFSLAAFPGKRNAELRSAIATADVCRLRKFAKQNKKPS